LEAIDTFRNDEESILDIVAQLQASASIRRAHTGQIRKGTEIPHLAHLLDFSINYDIKYRLGRDVESDEE